MSEFENLNPRAIAFVTYCYQIQARLAVPDMMSFLAMGRKTWYERLEGKPPIFADEAHKIATLLGRTLGNFIDDVREVEKNESFNAACPHAKQSARVNPLRDFRVIDRSADMELPKESFPLQGIGQLVQKFRKKRRITEANVESQIGLSPHGLKKISEGRKKISLIEMVRLANAMELDVDTVVDDAAAMPDPSMKRAFNEAAALTPLEPAAVAFVFKCHAQRATLAKVPCNTAPRLAQGLPVRADYIDKVVGYNGFTLDEFVQQVEDLQHTSAFQSGYVRNTGGKFNPLSDLAARPPRADWSEDRLALDVYRDFCAENFNFSKAHFQRVIGEHSSSKHLTLDGVRRIAGGLNVPIETAIQRAILQSPKGCGA